MLDSTSSPSLKKVRENPPSLLRGSCNLHGQKPNEIKVVVRSGVVWDRLEEEEKKQLDPTILRVSPLAKKWWESYLFSHTHKKKHNLYLVLFTQLFLSNFRVACMILPPPFDSSNNHGRKGRLKIFDWRSPTKFHSNQEQELVSPRPTKMLWLH